MAVIWPLGITTATLSFWDEQKVRALVPDFPAIFDRAVADWGKFKAGLKEGLFLPDEQRQVLAWYREFPRLWESIRLNFIQTPDGLEWGGTVDDFVGRLKGDELYRGGQLGLAPVIIAGVAIVGGVAAALWAVSYIKRQSNLSKMIDGVVQGQIPSAVLTQAIKAEQGTGLFTGVTGLLKWVLIGGVAFLILPLLGARRK